LRPIIRINLNRENIMPHRSKKDLTTAFNRLINLVEGRVAEGATDIGCYLLHDEGDGYSIDNFNKRGETMADRERVIQGYTNIIVLANSAIQDMNSRNVGSSQIGPDICIGEANGFHDLYKPSIEKEIAKLSDIMKGYPADHSNQ